MQIQIPDAAVPEITRRALAAGCDNVEQYILTLVLPAETAEPGGADYVEQAIDEGFASGVPTSPFSEFVGELRSRVDQAAVGEG